MVPRMFAVAGYLSVTRVNARCPLAARFKVSVAICAPDQAERYFGVTDRFTQCIRLDQSARVVARGRKPIPVPAVKLNAKAGLNACSQIGNPISVGAPRKD